MSLRFSEAWLVLFDRDEEWEWSPPKYDAKTAVQAAKEKARALLES